MIRFGKKPAQTAQTLSPARRRLFFTATLLIPFIFVALVELGLRVFHYGPDLSLFVTQVLHGRTYEVMNPQVKGRYFTQVQFSPRTSPDCFGVPKAGGAYRIFCLGGSTTVGYPYWYNGSFSTFLRDRLRRIFPKKKIEVINVGLTATNSFTVLDMARDLVRYEPDLFIVYDGHNEFYGALGVASRETPVAGPWFTGLYLRLIRWKSFLPLRDLVAAVSRLLDPSEDQETEGTMMERLARGRTVPLGSSLYNRGLSYFEQNLEDLSELCVNHTIPIILSTQVSNLRDNPPFVSGERPDLSDSARTKLNHRINEAMTLSMDGYLDRAGALFSDAAMLDTLRAESFYRLARCLDTLGEKGRALNAYTRARDLDQLRFRASTDFNNAIRQTCNERNVFLAEIERLFKAQSRDSLVGDGMVFDHIHPRSRGYFLMAKTYAEVMRQHGLLASREEWASADTLTDDTLWDSRHVTELDERMARRRTEILMSGWPFAPSRRRLREVSPDDVLGSVADSIIFGNMSWYQGHSEAARYYESAHDTGLAAVEYRTLIDQCTPGMEDSSGTIGDSNLPYLAAREIVHRFSASRCEMPGHRNAY